MPGRRFGGAPEAAAAMRDAIETQRPTLNALVMSLATPTAKVLIGCGLMFAVIEFGTSWLAQGVDLPTAAIVATLAMLVLAIALDRRFFGRALGASLAALGFRAPALGAVAVAVIVSLLMLVFFPAFAAVTGASIRLRPDWAWILVGAIAFNGIAEESLFRGYVFGGLRRAGHGFVPAATISLVIFAAVHLFLFIQNPFIVGLLATLVAVAAAFPLAYLFERGNNSLWPPAIMHVAAHTIRLVDVAEPFAMTANLSWLLLQIAAPFSVFVLGRRLVPAAVSRG
jgi:membrane protease YdiL (CAAX protease family)